MAARKRTGSDNGTDQKADALIARMKKARGYIYPEWEFAARQDPEFVETYNRIYELGLGEGKHVSAKVREFVAIALLAFRGGEKAGLVAHMERAIRFGATREELFEVLETCLGRKARKNLLPMQPGDVPATYADVDDLHADVPGRLEAECRCRTG